MPSKLPTARVSAEVPTEQSVLESFTQPRLLDLARLFGCEIHEPGMTKERLVGRLGRHLQGTLPALLGELGRDELRAVCRRHGLDESSKVRAELAAAVLTAAGIDPRASSHPVQPANDGLPREGPSASVGMLKLWRLREGTNRAVLDAHGWNDASVPLYRPIEDEERARVAAFEDEVIDGLYVLNAERAAAEFPGV